MLFLKKVNICFFVKLFQVSEREELRYRVIQLLCAEAMAHSRVMESLEVKIDLFQVIYLIFLVPPIPGNKVVCFLRGVI